MEYLKRFALWFVSGLGFASGVVLVMLASDLLKQPATPKIEESNVPLDKVVISDVEISELTKHLTVVGKVTNESDQRLRTVSVKIEVLRGGKILFECNDSLSSLPAVGKTMRFQADCQQVERTAIPAESTVRVRAWFAQSW